MKTIPKDAPWYVPFAPDGEGRRRYHRAQRLQGFADDLTIWQERGLLDSPRLVEKIAYRRYCIAHWQAYMDGTLLILGKPWESQQPSDTDLRT